MAPEEAVGRIVSYLTGNNPKHLKIIPWTAGLALGRLATSRSSGVTRVRIRGHWMYLDLKDNGVSTTLFVSGSWEDFELGFLLKQLGRGDMAVDAGAHVGYYTLAMARAVGGEGSVVAFEPDPGNFRLLKRNVEANRLRNVTLVQKALWESTGRRRLYKSPGNFGDHRAYDTADGRRSVEIDAISLDDYFEDRDRRVDLIKMDIQGAEFAAMRGMTSLLKSNKKVKVITEFWPAALRSAGDDPLACLKWLRDMGFGFLEIDEDRKLLKEIDEQGIVERYERTGRSANLCLCRAA